MTPVTWCGDAPSAADRPDTFGGDEIHVIYASPADGTDRFAQVASAIATDIGSIDAWWRVEDPTRTPRWDFAAFPSCSGFGALDISDVKLSHDTAYYNSAPAQRLPLIRDDLVAAGFTDPTKKYLVYYDQAQPATGTECGSAYVSAQSGGFAGVFIAPNLESTAPGKGCGSIEATGIRGGYSAVVAAHELVNALGALDDTSSPGPPHKCPTDPLHVCDNSLDVLAPTPSATTIDTAILDYKHDDYYAHSGSWWDVQDSPWLRHLNEAEAVVSVAVGAGGQSVVDTPQPNVSCAGATSCRWTWAAGSALTLTASPAMGYRFVGWTGCPSAQGATCSLTVAGAVSIRAQFAPPLHVLAFHLAFSHGGSLLTATLRLNEAGQADLVGCTFGTQPVASSTLRKTTATCAWTVPVRYRGHRIRGFVDLDYKGETVITKTFRVLVKK
ncbi:MAG TPA: hypothetical protein VGL76_10060 [Gaiellaceae bacterium]